MSSGLWQKDRRWYLSFCFFPSQDLRVASGLDSEIALEGQTRWLLGHEWPACYVLEAELALSCTISRSDWLETHWTWDEVTSSSPASSLTMVCGTCTPHDLLLPSDIKSPRSRDEGGSQSLISDWQPHDCPFKKLPIWYWIIDCCALSWGRLFLPLSLP